MKKITFNQREKFVRKGTKSVKGSSNNQFYLSEHSQTEQAKKMLSKLSQCDPYTHYLSQGLANEQFLSDWNEQIHKAQKKERKSHYSYHLHKKSTQKQKVGYNTEGVEEEKNGDGGEIEDSFLEGQKNDEKQKKKRYSQEKKLKQRTYHVKSVQRVITEVPSEERSIIKKISFTKIKKAPVSQSSITFLNPTEENKQMKDEKPSMKNVQAKKSRQKMVKQHKVSQTVFTSENYAEMLSLLQKRRKLSADTLAKRYRKRLGEINKLKQEKEREKKQEERKNSKKKVKSMNVMVYSLMRKRNQLINNEKQDKKQWLITKPQCPNLVKVYNMQLCKKSLDKTAQKVEELIKHSLKTKYSQG